MNPLRSRPVLYTVILAAVVLGAPRIHANLGALRILMAQAPTPPAAPPPPVQDPDITAFIKTTETALMSGKFGNLENEARIARDPDIRFAGGYSKIRYFYRSLGSFGEAACGCGKVMYSTKLTFGQKLHALRLWQAEQPGSLAASIALAELWRNLAWNARGSDYSSETSPEKLDLFQARLSVAASQISALDPNADPAIYDTELSLLRGAGDPRAEMANIYAKAMHAFPAYYFTYGNVAGLLEPRWFGHAHDLQDFLKLLADPAMGQPGLTAYSMVAETLLSDYDRDELLSQTGLDWPTIRHSFALRVKRYGSSLKLLNAELALATAAHDRAFAAQLVQQIGVKWDPNVWRDWRSFAAVADWANAKRA